MSHQQGLDSVEVCEQLANERRQAVVGVLQEEEQITLRYLSEVIAELEDKERKGVYIALYQSHIPKMEDYDVVEHDDRRSVIQRGDNFEQVSEALTCLEPQEERRGILSALLG